MTNPDGDLEDEEAARPFGGAKLDTPQRTGVTRHRAGLVDDAVVEGVERGMEKTKTIKLRHNYFNHSHHSHHSDRSHHSYYSDHSHPS